MAIDGEVVCLRAVERSDLDRYLRWVNDPDVTRTLSLRYPIGRAEEERILERLTRAQSYEDAVFAVEVRETGAHVGTIGLHRASFENRLATLGLMIGAKERWGQGLGHDALRTALGFAFWEMNLRLVRLDVLETNPRAVALYERVGFVREGVSRAAYRKRGANVDAFAMSITREEYEGIHGEPPDLRLEVLP